MNSRSEPTSTTELRVFGPFADGMVVQRDEPVRISGSASPGEILTISFRGQRRQVRADDGGLWSVRLESFEACASPSTLRIEGKDGRQVSFSDVLVGEVWVASGQSNMWWKVRDSSGGGKDEIAHPTIRLCTVPQRASLSPEEPEFIWKTCTPETIRDFSAVAYYFGVELQAALGIPVGLIHASWGGTRIQPWMRREALLLSESGRRDLQEAEGQFSDAEKRELWIEYGRDPVAWERKRVPADPGNGAVARGWASPDFDDAAWSVMQIPGRWMDAGPEYKQNGVLWFRRAIDVPSEWAGRDLVLHLGACDKHDTTYFNGEEVGSMGWETLDAWRTPRVYRIPGEFVRAGRNVIATRVYSYMTDGGLMGPSEEMCLSLPGEDAAMSVPLFGEWRFAIEHAFGLVPAPELPFGENNPNTPCILFENMIRPICGLDVRGVIWYQGESNSAQAKEYRHLFPSMIDDWRSAFQRPGMPFLFVQLANHLPPPTEPVEESRWAALREAQLMTLRVPATAMAVAIDLGETSNIHPRNKKDVGKRLALAALSRIYGQTNPWSGPIYDGYAIEGDGIRVRFQHTDGGLISSDGEPLRTFTVAGHDRKFHHAEAVIDGGTIVVRSEAVPSPVAVRYAWANNPPANLSNGAGLPASPFRTDPD